MRLRKDRVLVDLLLGAGLYLMNSLRDRLPDADELHDRYGDLRDRAKHTYGTVSDRVSRASDVIRGEDHQGMNTAAALLLGVGVGVGVGLLLAPASGDETRHNIKEKVRDFVSSEKRATGTYGG